jgi:hypothetical protein
MTTSIREGITSEVIATVEINKEGYLKIHLIIIATNNTNQSIPLTHKYILPISNANNVKVREVIVSNNKLMRKQPQPYIELLPLDTKKIEIDLNYISNNKVLQPREKYAFEVILNATGINMPSKDNTVLSMPYSIVPQKEYGNIDILYHSFDYTFVFEKPGPWWKNIFYSNEIVQNNSEDYLGHIIGLKNIRKPKDFLDFLNFNKTRYKFDKFVLNQGEIVRITMNRIYRPSVPGISIISFILGTAIDSAVQRFFQTNVWEAIWNFFVSLIRF